jgi:putative glycosyltransferase (TIGR04348 family)
MRISIVTPAPPRSRKGNRMTAVRWARLLRQLGHRVSIDQRYTGQPCDLLIALHAKRSADAIAQFRRQCPTSPLVLLLTGTDLYRDIRQSAVARRSLALADRLVLLQPHGAQHLPRDLRQKVRVIYQSVVPPRNIPPRLRQEFEVCVIGHLRPVKDPFRAALAARQVPADSRIRITHLGAALTPAMERQARREMQRNARYHWLGDRPHWQTMQLLARSRLLVLSSKMEGGANAVSEAITASVPLLCSRISGSIGLLGANYPGFSKSRTLRVWRGCCAAPKRIGRFIAGCTPGVAG